MACLKLMTACLYSLLYFVRKLAKIMCKLSCKLVIIQKLIFHKLSKNIKGQSGRRNKVLCSLCLSLIYENS